MTDLHTNVPSGSVQFNSQLSMLARVDTGIVVRVIMLLQCLSVIDIIAESLSILGKIQPQIIRGAGPAPGGG